MPARQIYLLSPRKLSPETIAVAFAKTSRSPETFHDIASELSDEKSARFHEKWVVGYGHASVAEHAILHIAIENVSRLAVECIESNRLASYTEKSTRYQQWDADSYHIPTELTAHPLLRTYHDICKLLFKTYTNILAPVKNLIKDGTPPRPDETDEAYDRRIRSEYVDSCRFLLPAASLANLGMTVNARTLEHAIGKMLSNPLNEVRAIGEEIKQVAKEEIPTLVKYADPIPALMETLNDLFALEIEHLERDGSEEKQDWCTLVDYDPQGEQKVLAAALLRSSEMSFQEALKTVQTAGREQQEALAAILLNRLGEHDIPLRELEYSTYTFELVIDQGGYGEFKRHRMMTQTPQILTTHLGYAMPRRIVHAGLESIYRNAMDSAAEAYEELAAWNPQVAAYVVPNGFNRRLLFSLNLREAFAFCRLRAAPNAHFSMRRVAHRMAEEIRRVHPLLSNYLHLPEETWQEVEEKFL